MSVGQMREFDVRSGNWSSYVERLEMYFIVNKVVDEFKLPTLISVMGEEAYDLLSTLASPQKPSVLTFRRAVELLSAHLQPKPSVLAERYKFRQRRQLVDETIADYVTELKKLSKYCEFNSTLDENLRDQLVCGLKSEVIRQRLFSEEGITYNRAIALALSLEAAERDASAVERPEITEGVHKLSLEECPKCGDKRHKAINCVYKDYVCSWCHEIGHLRRMCPKKQAQTAESAGGYHNTRSRGGRMGAGRGAGRARGWRGARGQRGAARGSQQRTPLHLMSEQDGDYDNEVHEEDSSENMYQMSLSNYKPA
ncbi:uncharacterized protein LOC114364819 isoform X2 [Ostrinia furnacalis]|uniref:uncharacterized protein LOC114364819 isoform X2 n=1 Tax=Ostrinia furnacalis TaxID=93504 RepID=UPI00103B6C95|nr:uncharacterized protein LOC114364819 isoform X2 [Ostrinia furnacalis]